MADKHSWAAPFKRPKGLLECSAKDRKTDETPRQVATLRPPDSQKSPVFMFTWCFPGVSWKLGAVNLGTPQYHPPKQHFAEGC